MFSQLSFTSVLVVDATGQAKFLISLNPPSDVFYIIWWILGLLYQTTGQLMQRVQSDRERESCQVVSPNSDQTV